jgi:hypothetical protein
VNIISKKYHTRPSALIYQARAFIPSKGLDNQKSPQIFEFHQTNAGIDKKQAQALFELCQMEESENIPIIFPQVFGFPLIMSLLTHPEFPEPIWRSLQIRNSITSHRIIKVGENLEFKLKSSEFRYLEKGAELDLVLKVEAEGELLWESSTTFFYKGKFKTKGAVVASSGPKIEGTKVADWKVPSGGGARYGSISGDYNGIHLSDFYAKIFGFKKAFLHPHRVIGQIISVITKLGQCPPNNLKLWFKGPVPYNSNVRLMKSDGPSDYSLHLEGDSRACVLFSMSEQ